jgi:predicted ATP-grasp superfamily ATP-dependent carboligase
LVNVEFKRDPRDGKCKLIECNARFTAAECLVAASGFELGAFVYRRVIGLPQEPLAEYRSGLRLWDPFRDFTSFLSLRRNGKLTFAKWLASVLHAQTFPYFAWSDPAPAFARAIRPFLRAIQVRSSGTRRSSLLAARGGALDPTL